MDNDNSAATVVTNTSNMSSIINSSLRDISDIQRCVNTAYDRCFRIDENGVEQALVCTTCDKFLMFEENVATIAPDKLKSMSHMFHWDVAPMSERKPGLEDYYKLSVKMPNREDNSWMQHLCLSPRGCLYKKSSRHQVGFLSCVSCKESIYKENLPFYSIVNGNYIGVAPEVLKDLTPVEVAFLSPVKTHGYCFRWRGGMNCEMRGQLVFMRVKPQRLAQASEELRGMGLNKNVVVIYSGNMTELQRTKLKKKTTIRPQKLMDAVEWLCNNHRGWKNVNLNEIRDDIKNVGPIQVDQARTVKSGNANVESTEVFTCYYPEGNAEKESGGCDRESTFKDFAAKMASMNYDVELKANIEKDFCNSTAEQLLLSSLLQFPCGLGGMEQTRRGDKNVVIRHVKVDEFVDHLSRQSKSEFQTPLFQLVMHSLFTRERLLKYSRLQLKGQVSAKLLAEGFNGKDFSKACQNRRNKRKRGQGTTKVSEKLLDYVNACSKSLPHTNDAAKKARSQAESMQHHFSTGSVFLTAAFDDENCILTQILSNERIDTNEDISTLSDAVLEKKRSEREVLRYKIPGVTAINFEMLLDIMVKEVVGWDMGSNEATEKPGFFGECEAFSLAVEEQGRRTLHGHMTLWIKGFKKLQQNLFFGNVAEKRESDGAYMDYFDRVCTTHVFEGTKSELLAAFDHECTQSSVRDRTLPVVVDDQELRNLRHKKGFASEGGKFAYCISCSKEWTHEELMSDYLCWKYGFCKPVESKEEAKVKGKHRARMFAHVVQWQRKGKSQEECPRNMINAVYQHHLSCHTASCFKCNKRGKGKGGHKCGPQCECRYRLPDRARPKARVKTESEGTPWFKWDGEQAKQPLVQILPKRKPYDLFQNVSCKAISESKLACNSNVSLITDGPVSQYQIKYQTKGNYDEESAEYKECEDEMKKVACRKHELDRSEALRLICKAAFAHNKTNVISPPLASYLIRNKSRFYFSHEFTFSPLNSLIRIHDNKSVDANVVLNKDGSTHFENQALNYLNRPTEFEMHSLKDFTEKCEVRKMPKKKAKKKDDNPIYAMIADTGYFKHPSINPKTQKTTLGARESTRRGYVMFSQWGIPDTSSFRGNLLNSPVTAINGKMERYSQFVLTMFCPHRTVSDIRCDKAQFYPYTMQLRKVYASEQQRKLDLNEEPICFSEENKRILQNVQNCTYNSLRYKITNDDLQSATDPFKGDGIIDYKDDTQDDKEDELQTDTYEDVTALFNDDEDDDCDDSDPDKLFQKMQGNYNFTEIRDKGKDECGYEIGIDVPQEATDDYGYPVPIQQRPLGRVPENRDERTKKHKRKNKPKQQKHKASRVVQVLYSKTEVKPRNVFDDKVIDVGDANGSVMSIREWGKAAMGSDTKQQRAFETIIASFLLTFYTSDAHEEDGLGEEEAQRVKAAYRKWREAMLDLMGARDPQLICLLHGPGGSGKSTVINLVVAYAKSYCEFIGHKFTKRTIVITAMSGVAATLLRGETCHLVCRLNCSSPPKQDKDEWYDTRLVIIDEISFAGRNNFERLYRNLCFFKDDKWTPYGGLNMIFAGDYSQLEPVGVMPVYKMDHLAEYHGKLTSLIELNGKWRFVDDPAWGDCLSRFREGVPTLEDIRNINDECVNRGPPPPGTQIATHMNADRDAMNSAIFEQYCENNKASDTGVVESACCIFMDSLQMRDDLKNYKDIESNRFKTHFYTHNGEDSLKLERGRADPVLKLYTDCPMMLTMNKDVANGQANGSRVTVKGVRLKVGETFEKLKFENNAVVNVCLASSVESIVLQHENDKIVPRLFELAPQKLTFTAKIHLEDDMAMDVAMKGVQFPIVSNSATTGHKLQGCTCKTLFVNDWYYGSNWAYVVLSRVRKMSGLYLKEPLSEDLTLYEMSPLMEDMMEDFRSRLLINDITDDEYDAILKKEDQYRCNWIRRGGTSLTPS